VDPKDTILKPEELKAIRDKVRKLDSQLSADREAYIALITAENQAIISFPAGEVEEKTKWIKSCSQNGITIEQAQQLNRIIPCLKFDSQKTGIKEVVEFTRSFWGGKDIWKSQEGQAFLKEKGISDNKDKEEEE